MHTLQKFNLIHDLDSMNCDPRGIATGTLALEIGAIIFPDQNWNDFVIRTLATWIPSTRIVLGPHARDRFLFMDGSYGFFAYRTDSTVEISCYYDHKDRLRGPAAQIDAVQFGTAMHSTARKIENWARRVGCMSRDLDILTDEVAALRDALRLVKY